MAACFDKTVKKIIISNLHNSKSDQLNGHYGHCAHWPEDQRRYCKKHKLKELV